MRPVDLAIALFVITIWGMNFVVVKVGLEEIPPFLFMALRFAVVAVVLLPFIRWPAGKFWHLLGYATMLGTIHFGMMFNAINYIDASTVALLSQLNTPFAVLISALFFKDYPGWRRILGIAIAFAGCIFIAGEPRFEGELFAIFLVVGGTLSWAIAAAQVKWIGEINPFALNGWMALMAAPQLLLISFLFEQGQIDALSAVTMQGIGAVLYQSVLVVIVGYGLWYGLIKRYPLSRVIPLTLLLPIVGVAGGTLLLGEALTWPMIWGGLLIFIGVGIVVMRQVQREATQDTKSVH